MKKEVPNPLNYAAIDDIENSGVEICEKKVQLKILRKPRKTEWRKKYLPLDNVDDVAINDIEKTGLEIHVDA